MRKVTDLQMNLFNENISNLKFDPKSRDEIPQMLRGIQHIYSDKESRDQVFTILKKTIPEGTSMNNGRPGMDLWKIFVLGTLRLNNNWDYDKLKEMADQHMSIRLMLGNASDDSTIYPLQTIKDNVSLFTPEILNQINEVVVRIGHSVAGKKEEEGLKTKVDSFVLETNVHYPTDINLLFDAIRKVILLIATLCFSMGLTIWRNSDSNLLKIKKLFNAVRRLKRSNSKNEKKKKEKAEKIIEAHLAYIELVKAFIEKAKIAIGILQHMEGTTNIATIMQIEAYIQYAEKLIDQIIRRVVDGETIPHAEKIFSIFEPHTEWISKGKAGVPQELGVRVAIMEDQYGFILHHRVMCNETDDKVAVPIILDAIEKFPDIKSCSFDKGFYNPENKGLLREVLRLVVLPKKGRLKQEDLELETSEEFIRERKKHPAVESAINALENHGLDRCPDHGIKGFKRYVALAVLARNLQILGAMLQKKEVKRLKRKEKYRETWDKNRLAA